jgi:epsilon-lactone hydrolase
MLIKYSIAQQSNIAKEPSMSNAALESTTIHPITPADAATVAAMRAAVAPMKGALRGTAARAPFDAIMEHVAAPQGVTYEPATIGGISGLWAIPQNAQLNSAILHIHGGWFHWGTAYAYRHLVGHIAARAKTRAFIPDYRLAPEHPFPAAVEDVQAVYRALAESGLQRIALTGDSAGGNLILVLLSLLAKSPAKIAPAGAVALSPVTDLALTGASWQTRAQADPYFVHSQAVELAASYLNGADPRNPLASPLYGDLANLPPIRIHTGDDEVLLDDSTRYVERAIAAGVDARLDLWMGMPHDVPGSVDQLEAANQALDAIGAFLVERLAA